MAHGSRDLYSTSAIDLQKSIKAHLSGDESNEEHGRSQRYDYKMLMRDMNVLEMRVVEEEVLFMLDKMRQYVLLNDWGSALKTRRTIIEKIRDYYDHDNKHYNLGAFEIADVVQETTNLEIPLPPEPEEEDNEYS